MPPPRPSRRRQSGRDDRMDARAPPPLVAAIIGSDLYAFIRASFPIVSGGRQFLPNWHVEAMAYELSEVMRGITRRLIITVPPRSLKSICASVALPAFALGHDPSRRIVCVSYSEGLARKHANDCRALMRSDLYRRIFPATRISPAKDTETEVMTTACDLGRRHVDRSRRESLDHRRSAQAARRSFRKRPRILKAMVLEHAAVAARPQDRGLDHCGHAAAVSR